jgi:hypothetical protein
VSAAAAAAGGGETARGFQDKPPGFGRGAGGEGAGAAAGPLFSNAAMRSLREPIFFGGGSAMVVDGG